jgi:cytochrome c-type biogenesis protein CcsB
VYAIAVVLYLTGFAIKNTVIQKRVSWIVFLAAFALHFAYFISRAMIAGRLPMSNQFEFAMSFALGISILYIVMKVKFKADWITAFAMPSALLLLIYALSLPREIRDLMPALRSQWFGLHIGTAVISYAAFVLAGCAGIKYLIALKKGQPEDSPQMRQMDFFSYRLIALGVLMLTIVILSGAVWAEEAWSSFWSWDPKELWSLITWIVYAIYLHQRLRVKWQGKRMAIFSIVAVGVVLFTFIGVNTLLPGLHSYR